MFCFFEFYVVFAFSKNCKLRYLCHVDIFLQI